MTITDVEAIPVRLPTHKPVRFANGEVHHAEHVLVRVQTEDGLEGVAEASPRLMTYGDTAQAVVALIRDAIAPMWIGEDERFIAARHAQLEHLVGNRPARAALDVALWDLLGKRAGLPVALLYGGARHRVAVAHLLGLGAPQEMAQEASDVASSLGVRAFKVKVGQTPQLDVQRTLAVREAVGRDAVLYLDANHGWSPTDALQVLDALERAGASIAWVEEPTPAEESIGRRWLLDRARVPVVADESATDLASAAKELREGRCHWLSIKAGRSGFFEAQALVGLARGLGARVLVGSQVEGALGVYANLHLAAGIAGAAPAELTSARAFSADLMEPPPIRDGWMALPERPGLGATVDEARLDALRVD